MVPRQHTKQAKQVCFRPDIFIVGGAHTRESILGASVYQSRISAASRALAQCDQQDWSRTQTFDVAIPPVFQSASLTQEADRPRKFSNLGGELAENFAVTQAQDRRLLRLSALEPLKAIGEWHDDESPAVRRGPGRG